MKRSFIIIFLIACSYAQADSWTQKANFPNGSRGGAFAFSIGNKGYVGGGLDENDTSKNDFWEYDQSTDVWTRKADFPGQNVSYAASFTIRNKGYVCTGASQSLISGNFYTQSYRNTWQYDPNTDRWTQESYFPGIVRASTVAFVIDSIAYVGAGYSPSFIFNDFYAFNPTTNLWSIIAPLPDSGSGGSTFSILDKGYITGLDRVDIAAGHDVYTSTLWEYTPSTDSWTTKANFPGNGRVFSASFTISNLGYFGTGGDNSGALSDLWKYDPISDAWTSKLSLPSNGREGSAYFTIGDKGYICFGDDQSFSTTLWEYSPENTKVEQVKSPPIKVNVFPNPFSGTAKITFSKELENGEVIISDMCGRTIEEKNDMHCKEFILNRNDLAAGMYFYTVKDNGLPIARDKIVVQ